MTRASRTSWKTLPPPQQREALGFAASFNDAETELLVLGLVPKEMEDKWFVYFERPAHRGPTVSLGSASLGPANRPPETQGSDSPHGWLSRPLSPAAPPSQCARAHPIARRGIPIS